jgi:hypothetical protein
VTRRLISDIVWRTRLMYVLMIPFVGLVWIGAAAQNDGFVSLALTLSIAFAYMLGPLVSVSMIGRREIRILPVTNRDLWVTSWIVSAVLIPLAISAVQSLAVITVATFTGSRAVSAETMFLASLYCFAYAGALVPIMPAQGYCMHNMSARQPRWLWAALAIACFAVFTGGLFLPFVIADDLPMTFDQFSWDATTTLALCFVISAVSLAWTPQRGGIVTPVQPARKTESTSRSIRLQRSSDRFTGVARVAWPIAATITVLSAVTLAGFVFYWATFASDTPLRSFLQNNAVLLFDTGFLPDRGMSDIWVIMAVAFITTSGPWQPFARLLKVLPLTTNQVNVLFLATPFAQWALVWLALIAAHLVVIGTFPGTARLDVFMFVGGVSALGHVLMIRYGQGGLGIVMLLGVLMSLVRRVSTDTWSVRPEVVLFAAGVVALVVAAAVNHRTLTRSTSSSKAYRGQTLPFGINAPGARP